MEALQPSRTIFLMLNSRNWSWDSEVFAVRMGYIAVNIIVVVSAIAWTMRSFFNKKLTVSNWVVFVLFYLGSPIVLYVRVRFSRQGLNTTGKFLVILGMMFMALSLFCAEEKPPPFP